MRSPLNGCVRKPGMAKSRGCEATSRTDRILRNLDTCSACTPLQRPVSYKSCSPLCRKLTITGHPSVSRIATRYKLLYVQHSLSAPEISITPRRAWCHMAQVPIQTIHTFRHSVKRNNRRSRYSLSRQSPDKASAGARMAAESATRQLRPEAATRLSCSGRFKLLLGVLAVAPLAGRHRALNLVDMLTASAPGRLSAGLALCC